MTDADAPAEDDEALDRFLEPKYPDVHVKLTGLDSNTGTLMGAVSSALKAHGVRPAEITEFRLACMSGTYADALRTMGEWVDVS